jgi:hypothetical protein
MDDEAALAAVREQIQLIRGEMQVTNKYMTYIYDDVIVIYIYNDDVIIL